MFKVLAIASAILAFYPACSFAMTDHQKACVLARSINGQPLFEPIGVSGYSRNLCTGQKVLASRELAAMNKLRKDSWRALGYTCTVDCSGHQAGYDWAEDNDIDDESMCTGSSRSFIEGCYAYVRHHK